MGWGENRGCVIYSRVQPGPISPTEGFVMVATFRQSTTGTKAHDFNPGHYLSRDRFYLRKNEVRH